MEHSNYSPSRLSRIINCPGSVELIDSLMVSKTIPKEQRSSYAEHGTMLHQIVEDHYVSGDLALLSLDTDDKFLIKECLTYMKILRQSKGHDNLVEKNESMIRLNEWGIPDVWGTLDRQLYDPMKRHVDIIDWKFGAGVQVYAEENPQLLAYTAGAIGWPTTIQTITLHIVQPAIEHFDAWNLTIDDLYEWVHGTLALAINKCSSPGAEINPGKTQCRWCEAKNHCITRLNYATDLAAKIFHAEKLLATAPDMKDLCALLEQAPAIDNAVNSIRSYVQREMEKGIEVSGYKLVSGRSNRKWLDEKETVKWLSEHTEIEELYASKLRSPSQMEKEVRSLKKNEGFKKLFHSPPGKTTMVSESDKRPAIDVNKSAINVFKEVGAPALSDNNSDKSEL